MTLKELNKKVEEKRLTFIETKDKKLKEKIIDEILAIKKEFTLDNIDEIQDDLKIHNYVKEVSEKAINKLMKDKADAFEIKDVYANLMSAKAMLNNYEGMITNNKKAIDQLANMLKGSLIEKSK